MNKTEHRRSRLLFAFFCIAMAALAIKLIYIQIICSDELKAAAVSQYGIAMEGLDTRGIILDRNGDPLTDTVNQYYYVIDKNRCSGLPERIESQWQLRQVAADDSDYLVYRSENFSIDVAENLKKKYGAYVFQSRARYSDDQIACHLIGYLNDDRKAGVSGIELMCQDRLRAGDGRITLWADAAGLILKGRTPCASGTSEKDGIEEKAVVTTIDRELQNICEDALQEQTRSGAALVMDAETGEILSWASAPVFNPNRIADCLEDGDCLINKVCQAAYAPGSVFKAVTAAAALESGKCDENTEFKCTGTTTVEGITLCCASGPEGGHGKLKMAQAMACSCNCYFANLGSIVGIEAIIEKAKEMGFGENPMPELYGSEAGNMPDEEETGPWDVSNISIGQGSITATPLQIACMTASVANGGFKVTPEILLRDEKEKSDGQRRRVMDQETAETIEDMLRMVMEEGTAKDSYSMPVWGKTGTAETGRESGGNNCWFTGYCRKNEKTYVVTVLVEGGKSGASDALPVFKKITDFMSDNF